MHTYKHAFDTLKKKRMIRGKSLKRLISFYNARGREPGSSTCKIKLYQLYDFIFEFC